jgi:hypothetical protein
MLRKVMGNTVQHSVSDQICVTSRIEKSDRKHKTNFVYMLWMKMVK